MRVLFRQSLPPCQHVAAAAAATSTTSAGCIRPNVLTPVLKNRADTPRRLVFILLLRRASSFDFLCTCFIFIFVNRVWALFRQSLPCRLVVLTVFSYVVAHTGYRRPPVLTSMLNQSWNTPLVCYCAAAFHASSFDLLYFCFLKCAICFCCCSVFSFVLCFCVLPYVMCFISFCGGGFFLMFQRFLGIFRARAFQY